MRFPTSLLVLPLLLSTPAPTPLVAQLQQKAQTTQSDLTASVRWNRLVPGFIAQNADRRKAVRRAAVAAKDSATLRQLTMNQPPLQFRVYTLLSIAQYAAANSARANHSVSSDAAVAAASAAILSQLYTDSAVRASIAAELSRDIDRVGTGSRGRELATAGRLLGEDVAARVTTWAPPTPMLVGPWNGTIPTGPGMWYTAKGVPPIGVLAAHARPWLLDSASQLRPPPPPAYGSPTFKAALEEVQRVARERTPEQTRIAQQWNAGDPWARWNEEAAAAIGRNHLSEVEAARVLAMLNVGASDAIIACFDAKYYYWTIRPSQADTTLVLADSVDLPNFPSYPSGHACSAGAFDAVLGHFFPRERAAFTRIAEEQAMSRLYGGIHYRFDNDGGLALGRKVALYDVQLERRGALNAWRDARPGVKR
ncbi:MAG TPA: vanadium-dependent haloperoxidase [Gemmatimonadaceae bacterium]|nr:vanadium-dependent haloperoxidase [Gemmatimonadaceae bacterium]